MQRISEEILSKCRALLEDGTADRVMGWENGEFFYDVTPAVFTKDTLDNMIYDDFCASNQSKYLIARRESVSGADQYQFLNYCYCWVPDRTL